MHCWCGFSGAKWMDSMPDLEMRTISPGSISRSEEHTSELQSPCNLVCRLLLEKKNSSPDELHPLIAAYPMDKAVHAIAYELNHRPDQSSDPVRGMLILLYKYYSTRSRASDSV